MIKKFKKFWQLIPETANNEFYGIRLHQICLVPLFVSNIQLLNLHSCSNFAPTQSLKMLWKTDVLLDRNHIYIDAEVPVFWRKTTWKVSLPLFDEWTFSDKSQVVSMHVFLCDNQTWTLKLLLHWRGNLYFSIQNRILSTLSIKISQEIEWNKDNIFNLSQFLFYYSHFHLLCPSHEVHNLIVTKSHLYFMHDLLNDMLCDWIEFCFCSKKKTQ